MSRKEIKCPKCKNVLGRVYHYGKKCNPEKLSKEEIRKKTLIHNFPEVFENNGAEIKRLYLEENNSILDLCKIYNVSHGKLRYFLTYLNIEIKGIKEISNLDSTREKYRNTCMERFGAENALGKNTAAYHKKNKTVKEKYNVDNVRQLKSVKDKINETMIERYGVIRKHNADKQKETKKNWSEEFRKIYSDKLRESKNQFTDEKWYAIAQKRLLTMKKNGTFKTTLIMNKVETKLGELLTTLNVAHSFSFYIDRYQYDFIIKDTKVLIEVQGDYWHANPVFYKKDDIIQYPGGRYIIAEQVWQRDIKKKIIAEKHGYQVIEIWENEIRKLTEKELSELLLLKIGNITQII